MNETDFTFAWEGAAAGSGTWQHLRVIRIRGTEALSSLYRYELVLFAREPAPEVDPADLIGTRATLRMATLTEPRFRVVHGLLIEAEEVGPTPHGMLYRAVLAPPLVRAMHRTRCRVFLDKTVRQTVDAVLQGDPELRRDDSAASSPDGGDEHAFSPAKELYAWRVMDTSRIDDPAARAYCVQYNESDFHFVSRLLEEEGIGYHFENGDGVCVLMLSDKDLGRTRLDPFLPLGPDIGGRTVSAMKLGARFRPCKVSLLDYNWLKPALDMAVAEPSPPAGADLVDYEYPGRYLEAPEKGKPIAAAKLERLETEANYATGEGTCRLLSAGSIFSLEHSSSRHEGEYLVTKLEVYGEQLGELPPNTATDLPPLGQPYRISFECARRGNHGALHESKFRPARATPKPRVRGTQTAFVTAEPSTQGAEIHVGGPPGGEIGCVRVKFHWDTELERHKKEPTSCWVRVNQVFAGAGEGAVFHPRVGVEVIVDFEDGDPDRPLIVGRVYNGQNRPPGGAPTVSTFKTMTSPGGGTHNELMFDDTAGRQQILLHTPRDWNSEVGNDRSEQVAKNSGSAVGVDRNETTGANRTTMVGANNTEVVGADESVTVGANRTATIGANQTEDITGNRKVTIASNDELTVAGTQDIQVTGAQTSTYAAAQQISVTSNQTIDVGGAQMTAVTGPQEQTSGTSQKLEAPAQTFIAAGEQKLQSTTLTANASASAKVDTALLELVGSGAIKMEAGQLVITSGPVTITGGAITITGGEVKIAAGSVGVSGGTVDVVGGIVKLN